MSTDKIAALHSDITQYTKLIEALHEAEKALETARDQLIEWSMDNGHLLGLLVDYDPEVVPAELRSFKHWNPPRSTAAAEPAKPDHPAPTKSTP